MFVSMLLSASLGTSYAYTLNHTRIQGCSRPFLRDGEMLLLFLPLGILARVAWCVA